MRRLRGDSVTALREGFTTGSCAAAAALACCLRQRDGVCPDHVSIVLPTGTFYLAAILPHADGSCGVIKDSGDDPDITNGMEIIAQVERLEEDGDIVFHAGEGVGTVTESGLKVAVGEPAINPVPRRMIEEAVRSVFGTRAAHVTISIPGGEAIARRTFNPRLGIQGGLSILGTSGVVRPMSDEALRDSLHLEMQMRISQGKRTLILTFGNQGEEALHALYPDGCILQMSNEVGFMLDSALELGAERLIIGGHAGKMCKVAAGLMQTHSKYGDARFEAIITHLALMGTPVGILRAVQACTTTDAAMKIIAEHGLDDVWNRLAQAARRYCRMRTRYEIPIHTLILNTQGRVLGESTEDEA